MSRRMKTEYMRRFTGPRWDTYGSCYRDLVQYRGVRRLLEQAHWPWVWTGWDSGSDSDSGASTPPPDPRCPATHLQAPGAQPETGDRPGAQAGDRPGAQAGDRPGAQAGDRPGAQAGDRPGAQAGDRPGGQAGDRPGGQAGDRPGAQAGDRPGAQAGDRPGAQAGDRPGAQAGDRPGAQAGDRPGAQAGDRPGAQAGDRPGAQAGDRPGAQAGDRPGAQAGDRPGAARCPAAGFNVSAKEIIVQGIQRDKSHDQAKGDLCGYHCVKSASLEKSLKTSRASPAAVVTKETKGPFAMYGWAEKEVKVGCKKTYNVGASALPGQIYESAVRAQDRHQVQRAMRVSRVRGTEPPTNCAADHQSKTFQNRKTTSEHSPVGALPTAGDDDPWLSEYMRCFSTRSL